MLPLASRLTRITRSRHPHRSRIHPPRNPTAHKRREILIFILITPKLRLHSLLLLLTLLVPILPELDDSGNIIHLFLRLIGFEPVRAFGGDEGRVVAGEGTGVGDDFGEGGAEAVVALVRVVGMPSSGGIAVLQNKRCEISLIPSMEAGCRKVDHIHLPSVATNPLINEQDEHHS